MTARDPEIGETAKNGCSLRGWYFVVAVVAATLIVAAEDEVFGAPLGPFSAGGDRPTIEHFNHTLDENFLVEAKPNEKPTFAILPLNNVNGVFNRKIEVFGIPVFSYSGVSDEDLVLSANVLAQWLDNDENGSVDHTVMLDELADRNSYLFIVENQSQVNTYNFQNGTEAFSLDAESIQRDWYTSGPSGDADGTMEESFHMISDVGYGGLYPDVFGRTSGTDLTDAMDVARGGHFQQTPNQYPAGAWYTYDEQGCGYNCMASEYFHWGMISILGVNVNRGEHIESQWDLYTRELVESTDPALFGLLTDPEYLFPTQYPDGTYGLETLKPKVAYTVRDTDFDGLGDATVTWVRSVGEVDGASGGNLSRLFTKFDLPDLPEATPVLESAVLRFFLEEIEGTVAGPVSVYHSRSDNDLDALAADYQDTSYVDTLLDLIQPTDVAGQFYELDVTDLVLEDFAFDGLDPLSAFRLQVNEEVFFEDNQHERYIVSDQWNLDTRPELHLSFTTGVPLPTVLGELLIDSPPATVGINGAVEIAVGAEVNVTPGYTQAPGSIESILAVTHTGTLSGVFANEGEHLRDGLFIESIAYNAGDVTVGILQATPGDADGDGMVTINIPQPFPLPALDGDALAVLPNIGISSGAEWPDGDFDGDGAVTINLPQPFPLPALDGDVLVLLNNIGETVMPDAAAVGTAHMHYNAATGEVTFSTGAGITDLFINSVDAVKSAAGMVSFGDSLVVNEPTDATWLSVGGFAGGDHYAGFVLQPGLTPFDGSSGDFVFFYNGSNLGQIVVDTPAVPEPSTIVLAVLALVSLVACGRRLRGAVHS